MKSAHYYGFVGVGSRIWELVQTPVRVDELCARLVDEFDVDRSRCETDALRFLAELRDKGLIEVRGGA
jgi:hypothetical protein